MYVIGTAGHVDHGKSTLVEALTGIDPDRWAEEKAREMTIDLGFAWLTLDGIDAPIGVVDVPGHRDFIENMLAGVGGIDLALFVIAADEGVMPQTQEHLAILDLLQVSAGVVAVTKSDLVDDEEWLELVMLDIAETLAETSLAEAPLIPVSAHTGAGLAEVRAALADALAAVPARADRGRPRMPIDRVFTLTGFGTVVTGTLSDGRLHVGDQVVIQPGDRAARIRGIQSHNLSVSSVGPGRRVAVNITGLDRDALQRGDILATPGTLRETLLFDASYRHLTTAPGPLKHNVEVKLFVGAAEVMARTRILGAAHIEPGGTGWLQLALRRPTAVARNDRFILRRPSPGSTIGGGIVLDPHPGRRHRRFQTAVLDRLATLAAGTPADILLQTLRRLEPLTRAELLRASGLSDPDAEAAWAELQGNGDLLALGPRVVSREGYARLRERAVAIVDAYHADYPLRLAMPREELRSRLRLDTPFFNALTRALVTAEELTEVGAGLKRPEHEIRFSPAQRAAIDRLLATHREAGINSPSVKESKMAVGDDVYFALVESRQLRPVSGDVVFEAAVYERAVEGIVAHLRAQGTINAAQVRDLFSTSRKYAIALLEHLDDRRLTRRVGDNRELLEYNRKPS